MQIEKQQNREITEGKEQERDDRYERLDEVISGYGGMDGTLITILHHAQKIFGYLPREVQLYIARETGIPFSEVYSVVSFYSLFTMKPRGKYTIEVCMGTACYVKGSEKILEKLKEELGIEPGEVTDDGKFTIETTRCLGACSLAPVIVINGELFGKMSGEEIEKILDKYRNIKELVK